MFLFCFQFFFCLVPLSSPWIYGELCHALLATEHLQQLFESAEYLDDVRFELDKGDGGGEGETHQTHSVKLIYSCKIIFKRHQVFVENLQYIYIVVLLDKEQGS